MRIRSTAASLLVLGIFAVTMAPRADAQPALPLVRIDASNAPSLFVNECVSPAQVGVTAGRVTLSRSGSVSTALTVAYSATGPVAVRAGSAKFVAGSRTVAIPIVPLATAAPSGGHVDVQLLSRAGYGLGNPADVRIEITVALSSCPLPSTTTPTTIGPRVVTRELPRTGTENAVAAIFGAAFVLGGGVLLVASRRRVSA